LTAIKRLAAAAILALAPLSALAAPEIEVVASLAQGPGNIAVTADGRVIVSLHQFYAPDLRVVEIGADGTLKPFPNRLWASAPAAGAGASTGVDAVLGLRAGADGVVWLLDNGRLSGAVPKLVGWDTHADRLVRVIHLPAPATTPNSFQNDLAIDPAHNAIYLADPAGGANAALVVVDLTTGVSRRVLEGDRSLVPEDLEIAVDGKPLRVKRPDGSIVAPKVGVNPITLDKANQWLYFGPMSGRSLYRARTSDLLDPSLAPEQLSGRIERFGDKPGSAGITIDDAGNVYVTDVAANAIGVIAPDGKYRVLVQDDELLDWPDGLSTGPDGYIYATVNRLHKSAVLSADESSAAPPFYVVRIKALAPVSIGR